MSSYYDFLPPYSFRVFLQGAPRKMHDSLEQLLSDAGHALDKAFLYEGRLSNYVSTDAIRCGTN